MILGNNFSKDVPSKSSNSFAEDKPSQGGSFSENKPTQGGSFADASPIVGSNFAKDSPAKSDMIMDGDNTTGGVYGGDFGTFGDIYGQGVFGGITHFQARTPNTPIH